MIALLVASGLVLLGMGYALGLLIGLAISSRSGWPDRKRAEEKSIVLLRSWLTPKQATQWDSHKAFDVVGSDTGARYRIRYGTAMNIHELGCDGKAVAQWCFAPQGNLAIGDVLLAQKVALETMETQALSKANRLGR
jgi:hypothetical protein